MSANLSATFYLISGILFILALRGLSSPETSRQGNYFGIAGMAIAIVVTFLSVGNFSSGFIYVLIFLYAYLLYFQLIIFCQKSFFLAVSFATINAHPFNIVIIKIKIILRTFPHIHLTYQNLQINRFVLPLSLPLPKVYTTYVCILCLLS